MRYTFGDDNRIHAKPPSPSRGGHCTADLVERSSNELQPRREYPVSQRRGSVASMALDELPPACLDGRGDSRRGWSEWATDQRMERLGVLGGTLGGTEDATEAAADATGYNAARC